ncbi:MAG: hypothetical protein RIR86_3067 [Acidobacteriota bacterium]|jgi:ribonuclease G
MSKELIVSVNGREKKIAIVEDDLVTEFYVERGDENQGIVGNIYKGRVMKVLPGMQSAFVDIGLERDSFLYVSDFFDEEDLDEGSGDEKKETGRAPGRADRQSDRGERSERGRGHREHPRYEPQVAAVEEDKEIDLNAAISHFEEIAEEPILESLPDDELTEDAEAPVRPVAREAAKPSPRQRRQRRLSYGEETPEEAPAVIVEAEEEPEVVSEPEPRSEAGAERRTEGEEEFSGGRRRRRPRRRRPAEAVEEETGAVEPAAPAGQDDEATGRLVAAPAEESEPGVMVGTLSSLVISHHEPLERITDDEAGLVDGEMLKDAMMQDRISGRIHDEERKVSLVEVDPTPEVTVGSLQAQLPAASELERISDDAENAAQVQSVAEVAPRAAGQDETGELSEEIPVGAETIEETSEASEAGASDEAAAVEEPLEDAEAEVRQKPRRGEFATRRGGRGRRRTYRPRGEEGASEGEPAGPAEVEEPVAAPPIVPPRASAERYHRPVISDLLREGQEIIVQIAKEPIGQKGARITSHIALPGRYIVYMPTVEHIGVSRKIGTDEERQRLKRTLHTLRAEAGATGGFIVRTAANGCPTEELREDMHYLIRTWTEIRRRSERIKAPSIVHRDLDLIQRILRDQLSTEFSAIRVDNEFEYERIVDFVNRFAPKLVNRVKLYTRETPILEHYGVQGEIDKAVKPRVWLKSGGYIVINQTEALVAIDVNTGKFVGKSNRLEDTIVKTNLEAAKEIVRQIRLRDLGGIIVLDFIDMEERRNRQKVMQALEMELKNDRSPSKILQFNDFGLVAITRKRVKQSLERTLCTPCHYCGGGGMIKSSQTICYEILAEARRVSKNVDSHNEVILRVNPDVAKALRSSERDILNEVEAYLGGVVTIKSDPTVHQEQFDIALA